MRNMHLGLLYTVVRHCFCGLLATALIASGCVRRARIHAQTTGIITPICFHNPSRRLFRRCIRWLIRNGYTIISSRQLVGILRSGESIPNGAAWITLDDGWKDILTDVIPAVSECNVPVTIFLPSGVVAGDGLFPWLHNRAHPSFDPHPVRPVRPGERDAISRSDLEALVRLPQVSVGGHTVSHAITPSCSDELLRQQIGPDRRALAGWTHQDVDCFAYPQGLFDGREREVLIGSGYQLAATTENAFITRDTDPYLVPRFTVASTIPFPEALCNMVGVWQPAIAPFKAALRRIAAIGHSFQRPNHSSHSGTSAPQW